VLDDPDDGAVLLLLLSDGADVAVGAGWDVVLEFGPEFGTAMLTLGGAGLGTVTLTLGGAKGDAGTVVVRSRSIIVRVGVTVGF